MRYLLTLSAGLVGMGLGLVLGLHVDAVLAGWGVLVLASVALIAVYVSEEAQAIKKSLGIGGDG